LAFLNFFLYSIDRGTAAPQPRPEFLPACPLLVFKQALRRAIAVLLFFMAEFAFLIFIMAQLHGQMPSM
jgi:hypothetical protein